MSDGRRQKIMTLTVQDMVHIASALLDGRWVVIDNVPSNTKIEMVKFLYNEQRTNFTGVQLMLGNENFPPVAVGEKYPEINAKISDLTEVSQAMIADLKEESSAYAQGMKDGRRAMLELLRHSNAIGIRPDGRVLTRRELLFPSVDVEGVTVLLSNQPGEADQLFRPLAGEDSVEMTPEEQGSQQHAAGENHGASPQNRDEEQRQKIIASMRRESSRLRSVAKGPSVSANEDDEDDASLTTTLVLV